MAFMTWSHDKANMAGFYFSKNYFGERVGWSRLSLVHQAFPKMGSAGLANGADIRGWRCSCLAVGVGAGRRVHVEGVHTLEGCQVSPGTGTRISAGKLVSTVTGVV